MNRLESKENNRISSVIGPVLFNVPVTDTFFYRENPDM